MNLPEKLSAKERRLLSYRKKTRLFKADLEKPTLESIVLLPATGDDEGNQLHSRDQGLAMDLKFAKFSAASEPDGSRVTVQALFNGTPVGNVLSDTTPLDDSFFDQVLTIPANMTNVAGKHEIKYRVVLRINPQDSLPLFINVDTAAPTPTTQTIIPDVIKNEGITAEYFDTATSVPLDYLGTYGGAKIGDTVEYWIKETGEPASTAVRIDSIVRTTIAAPLKTEKLTKTLVGIDEGKVDLWVIVTDRKGNVSAASPAVVVDVSLFPAPKNEAVIVPLHDDDNIILFEDARTPVAVNLAYDNFKTGDKLRYSVSDQTPVLEVDITGATFSQPFTYKYLQHGGDGEKEVDFKWQIKRNNKLYPATPHIKKLTIDLRKPGLPPDPENPGLPGSPDPRFELITVQGAGPRDNYLIPEDGDNGATASVLIYEGHKAGDVIQLMYIGVPVEETDGGVITLDGTEGDDFVLDFRIPAAFIKGGGNNKQTRVEYVVSHLLNSTVTWSGVQYVDVYVNRLPLAQPDFPITGDAGDGPELHCGSLVHNGDLNKKAVEATFGADSKFANVEITFTIQGYENAIGEDGKNQPGLIITAAKAEVKKTPDAAEAGAGFSVYFSYEVFELIKNGWCTITCAALQEGYETWSDPRTFRVGMQVGSGDFCPLMSPRKT